MKKTKDERRLTIEKRRGTKWEIPFFNRLSSLVSRLSSLAFVCVGLWLILSAPAFAASSWLAITAFTSGELSPLMDGRWDMKNYVSGCNTLENFLIYPQGPAVKRPGFEYIAEVKNSAKPARLVPFSFSTEQAYALEFGESGGAGYVRFYMNKGQILWASGASPYEIASPYLSTDLPNLKYCQSADVMYLTHPNYPVQKVSRSGHTSFTLAPVSFTGNPFGGATGYPRSCTFHEDRLIFAGTTPYPTTMWFSKSGVYENFTTGALDDDAIEIALASDQVNAIMWLVSSTYLTIGTTAGEWRLSAVDPDDPITPTNLTAKRELVYGAADRMPVLIGKDTIYVQRHGKKVRRLAYNWESAGYVAPDLTVVSEHITGSGVSEMCYQKEPYSAVWAVRADGTALSLTYLPEHDVYAWQRHPTQGNVESMAVIPGSTQDDLYALIKRSINGGTSRFVELMAPPFSSSSLSDAFFVDAGISYSGSPATHFSGATHLMNTPVVALADGVVRSGITVDAFGGVTLTVAASKVHLGLPYTSTLQTMRLEAPEDDGATSQGRTKRYSHAIVRLHKTPSFSIGPDSANMLDVLIGVSLFSGDKKVGLKGGWNTDGYIRVQQDDPLPLTIKALIVHVETGD